MNTSFKILLLLTLVTHFKAVEAQERLYIFTPDSVEITQDVSNSYFNVITLTLDTLIDVKTDATINESDPYYWEKQTIEFIEPVFTRFFKTKAGINAIWFLKSDSTIVQKGQFNSKGLAYGAFENLKPVKGFCYFENGYKTGTEVIYPPETDIMIIRTFKASELHGKTIELNKNLEVIALTEYTEGKKHGLDEAYWINNNMKQIRYSNIYKHGKITDGVHFVYHPDGSIFAKIEYKDGVYDGWTYLYNTRGELIEKKLYSKGKYVKQ